MGVANADGYHSHRYTLALGELGQTGQTLMQANVAIVPFNPALWKHHHLLALGQQIDGQTKACHGGSALIDRKTTQAMQKPTLQAGHFIDRDHEAAIAPRDPSSGRVGKQKGIPAGPVGRGQ